MFPPQRPAEHFLNVPRGAKKIDPGNLCPAADRCVASAILNDTRELASAKDAKERLRLLKSLGHWVADIHQPLHVSFEDEQRRQFCRRHGPLLRQSAPRLGYVALSRKGSAPMKRRSRRRLSARSRTRTAKAWAPPGLDAAAVAAWANESLAIAESPAVQYCVPHGDSCWYSPDAQQFSKDKRKVEITAAT